MTHTTFNGVSHFTMYASEIANYRNDSSNSLSNYRFRKFIQTKRFKALLILALPFLMLARFRQNKRVGLMVAVGMSAALVAHTTLV